MNNNPSTTLPNGSIVYLTNDQTNALKEVINFILSDEKYFILDGFGGTGKSTLIRKIIEEITRLSKPANALGADIHSNIYITATTNKAVDNILSVFGDLNVSASTIHSLFNLRVHTDYKNNRTSLLQSSAPDLYDALIIVDEYTKIHNEKGNDVFYYIDRLVSHQNDVKVIFVGDRFQQTDFRGNRAYIYQKPFKKVALTETVRAVEGSTIATNNHMLRNAVETLNYSEMVLDGQETMHVDKDTFLQMAIDAFKKRENAKVLAWKNATVNHYNRVIKEAVSGEGKLVAGDTAINNFFVPDTNQEKTLATEKEVFITFMSKDDLYTIPNTNRSISGNWVHLSGVDKNFFLPHDQLDRKKLESDIRKGSVVDESDIFITLKKIDTMFVDLRPVYASTVDKSQGSTYETAFIDLDCIMSCRMLSAQTRLLYVANSRASKKVVFTGGY